MKLAFSNVACPAWDLATTVERAKEYGYQGIELRSLQGQVNLTLAPEIASNPERIGDLLRKTGVELVCLASAASFHSPDPKHRAENLAQVREYIDLASALGSPFVRVFPGEVSKARFFGYERRETTMGRIAEALRELAPFAAARKVVILVENNGDFCDSAALWYLVDAATSPSVRCCWNPFAARIRNERPTTSIPRLGNKLSLIRICEGKFDVTGAFEGYALPGQGSTEIPRLVQLLKGVNYGGYLMFDWPKMWVGSLADPEKALPAAKAYLQPLLDEKPIVLTAYKGDKNAPRYAEAPAS